MAHRVAQAIEVSQFINLTAAGADAIFIGGDFNLQPKDLGIKIIKSNVGLYDAWLTQVCLIYQF